MRAQLLAFLIAVAQLAARPLAAADGDLDPTFSTDGKVVVAWSLSASAEAVAAAPGGELLAAGEMSGEWVVSRLTRTGGLDAGWAIVFDPFDFAPAGANDTREVHAAGVDPLGRVVLAGVVRDSLDRFRPAVARLTPGGALDATFSGDGLVMAGSVPLGWDLGFVSAAHVGRDGGVVFAGDCTDCPGPGSEGIFVLRLLPDGQPDPSFSGDGWQAFALPLDGAVADAVTVTASGAILLGGPGSASSQDWVWAVRLTPSGQFDPAFSGDGQLYLARLFGPRRVNDLAVDPNSGRTVLGLGDADALSLAGAELIGLAANGELDTAFGTGGALDLDLEEGTELFAVGFQSDGKIVAAGGIDAVGSQAGGFFLARALPDGTLDPSYDDNGVKRVEFDRTANGEDRALALTLSGGRLVAAGFARGSDPGRAFAVLRTTSDLVFADGFESGGATPWGRPN